jgi:cephalosporin hydroxylase
MRRDEELMSSALQVKVTAGHEYLWVHQTNWFGEPCLQLPTDLIAIAEIIFQARPQFVVECGVAWGGTTLFLASLLRITGGEAVVGIDIFIPDDLRMRLRARSEVRDAIRLIEGSTVDKATHAEVCANLQESDRVMIILDSDHTHDHVLKELELYAPLVGVGQYLICGDTSIELQPPAPLRPRPWGRGNNPATALRAYLAQPDHVDLRVDEEVENRLLMSNNWGGFLRRHQ